MRNLLVIILFISTTVFPAEKNTFEIYRNKAINANSYRDALTYLDSAYIAAKSDNEFIRLFNSYGKTYYHLTDFYSSIEYLDSALLLSYKSNYFDFLPYILNNKALSYAEIYKVDSALLLFHKVLNTIDKSYRGAVLNNIGRCYRYINNIDSSTYYFNQAFHYKLETKGLNNYSTLLTALEIIENTGNKTLIDKIKIPLSKLNNDYLLGRYNIYTGQYNQAEKLLTGDYIHLLRIYRDSKQYTKAVSMMDSLRNSYLDIESKLFLQANRRLIYKNAIDQALQTDTLAALKLAVKSRGNLLREKLGAETYKIPESYNYFDFDSVIYLFHASRKRIRLYKVTVNEEFKAQYNTFIRCLQIDSVKNNYYQAYRQYCESSFYLFSKLVPYRSDKMTIIPDGRVHYIPFEALLTEIPDTTEPDYKVLPYLMLQSDIHYDYLLQFHPISKEKIKLTCLAPDLRLIFSKKMARKLRIYRGRIYTGNEAISEHLAEGNLLHIEAHYSPADRYIVFPDTLLYIENISYLPKELSIIATCYSGIGMDYAGEGVFSPGRSFYQAGSKSVLESIWESDGESSYMLLNEFYKNLNAGKSKSDALTLAKLKYLQKCLHSRSHPFYWAHIRVFGNDCPLGIKKRYNALFLIGAIGIIVILQYFFRLLRK